MSVSEEGYPVWQRGSVWFSLCQFRHSILCASSMRPGQTTNITQIIADTLSKIWDLEVLCPCVDGGAAICEGQCLSKTAQALGMTVGERVGLSTTHPSALKDGWSLRYGKPLISRSRAAPEYLACIFTSSLTAALPWLHSWGSQILSALAWAQVAPACDYARMTFLRAMHKPMRRVYSASPWNAENTMRACTPPAMRTVCGGHKINALAQAPCQMERQTLHRHRDTP